MEQIVEWILTLSAWEFVAVAVIAIYVLNMILGD